ncbi:hypothetical protein F4778DRAFT_366951 [Xylariomycetidae sp. FL2044]|nr:hypothetical protein F4778DRAFT_366951 [Xylariomycetidae sp. FL2044]
MKNEDFADEWTACRSILEIALNEGIVEPKDCGFVDSDDNFYPCVTRECEDGWSEGSDWSEFSMEEDEYYSMKFPEHSMMDLVTYKRIESFLEELSESDDDGVLQPRHHHVRYRVKEQPSDSIKRSCHRLLRLWVPSRADRWREGVHCEYYTIKEQIKAILYDLEFPTDISEANHLRRQGAKSGLSTWDNQNLERSYSFLKSVLHGPREHREDVDTGMGWNGELYYKFKWPPNIRYRSPSESPWEAALRSLSIREWLKRTENSHSA